MNESTFEDHPAVLAAVRKLDETEDPDGLTLEEVMLCFYRRPCRRISPGTDQLFKKYGRGSVLVYKDEVVLILDPEDNTLHFPHRRSKFIGAPKRRYTGVLPNSRFYTSGGVLVYVSEPKAVELLRGLFRAPAESNEGKVGGFSLFSSNANGKLNDHRCPEAWGLYGGIDARRLMRSRVVPDPELI
jgi:hypothetical protein